MMLDWLAGAADPAEPADRASRAESAGQHTLPAAVLVTVAMVEGSGPREPGAKMLVMAAHTYDTIGGGHLELRAVEIARGMLASARAEHAVRLERFALGPTLGQCCGGVVHLAFELVVGNLRNVLAVLQQRRQHDSWRVTAIDGVPDSALFDAGGAALAGAARDASAALLPARLSTQVWQDADGRRWLIDACLAPRAHLTLFGAGHVGAAIVRALAELPCTVTWVDERDAMFPDRVPANVRSEATDTPEALVAAAPPGGSFLVMTHSHALDQRLTETIMALPGHGWFGLIGSKTKRRQFEHRLLARGVAAERLAGMVCPIGLPGISSKLPAMIAASVCAQLLMVWEAAGLLAQPSASPASPASAAVPLRLVTPSLAATPTTPTTPPILQRSFK